MTNLGNHSCTLHFRHWSILSQCYWHYSFHFNPGTVCVIAHPQRVTPTSLCIACFLSFWSFGLSAAHFRLSQLPPQRPEAPPSLRGKAACEAAGKRLISPSTSCLALGKAPPCSTSSPCHGWKTGITILTRRLRINELIFIEHLENTKWTNPYLSLCRTSLQTKLPLGNQDPCI